jgi:hypothetical protein
MTAFAGSEDPPIRGILSSLFGFGDLCSYRGPLQLRVAASRRHIPECLAQVLKDLALFCCLVPSVSGIAVSAATFVV